MFLNFILHLLLCLIIASLGIAFLLKLIAYFTLENKYFKLFLLVIENVISFLTISVPFTFLVSALTKPNVEISSDTFSTIVFSLTFVGLKTWAFSSNKFDLNQITRLLEFITIIQDNLKQDNGQIFNFRELQRYSEELVNENETSVEYLLISEYLLICYKSYLNGLCSENTLNYYLSHLNYELTKRKNLFSSYKSKYILSFTFPKWLYRNLDINLYKKSHKRIKKLEKKLKKFRPTSNQYQKLNMELNFEKKRLLRFRRKAVFYTMNIK